MEGIKVCKKTLKTSVFVSVGSTLIGTIIVFCFIIIPFLEKSIKKQFNDFAGSEKENLRIIATYNLLEKKVSYGLLLKEVQLIEKAIVKERKKNKDIELKRNRLTINEMEDYVIFLYIYQQIKGVNVRGFIANTCGESGFNKNCISKVGAKGLNQLMPKTFKDLNEDVLFKYNYVNIFSVYHNTKAGIQYWIYSREYLKHILKREPTVAEIAMGYNAGPRRVAHVLRAGLNLSHLPKETQKHGKKVEWYYNKIKNQDYSNFWYYAKYYKGK